MTNKKGFTLIEIVVVVVILGLLISLSMSVFFKSSDRVKDKIDQIALNNLKAAAIIYAKDIKLRDCGNCVDYSLNMDCVSSGTPSIEQGRCSLKNYVKVSLGYLKQNNYFSDPANKCYKLDGSNNKLPDTAIDIIIYRYNTDYFVGFNAVFCAK